MKSAQFIDIFKQGNLLIPLYFLKQYKKLKVSLEEFVFLIYLYQLGDKSLFNPTKYALDLAIDSARVMEFIDTLVNKKLIQVEVIKNDKGLKEEVILLDGFYRKLSLLLVEENNEQGHCQSNIFEVVEKEFGRTLSPIEYEIIKSWLESGVSEDLVLAALEETVFNGVTNLRYMDKILYDWTKKGYKTSDDVEKAKSRLIEEKKESKKLELFDYDWFDDEESEQS